MKGLKMTYVYLAILSLLVFASASQAAGIADTKHNLSTSGTGAIHATSGTAEICVFCHTPHGADTNVAAPLWNRAQTTATFSLYSSSTLDALPTQPTGTSLACLSCHDGTVAFDAIRNLPGSGGYTNTPSVDGTSTWTFVGTPDKKMPDGITLIGTDLRNDHPISMVFADARSPSSTSASQTAGFRTITTTGSKKCVGNGIADCDDPAALPLSSATIGGSADYVQCTSCHDPHRSDTPTFLRKSNDGSALCLTCHVKDG